MHFIIELILEFIGSVLVLVVRLTWPGVLCGLAAGTAAHCLRLEHRPWQAAAWMFLVVWLAVTVCWIWLRLRRTKQFLDG